MTVASAEAINRMRYLSDLLRVLENEILSAINEGRYGELSSLSTKHQAMTKEFIELAKTA